MMKWLAPGNVKVASTKADLMPINKMEVHVVNSSSLMNAAVSLVFPMLSQSIKDQIFFHYQNYPSLHEHVGRDILPAEYGGLREEIDYDASIDFLYQNSDYLNKVHSYGYTADPTLTGKDKKKGFFKSKDNRVIADSI